MAMGQSSIYGDFNCLAGDKFTFTVSNFSSQSQANFQIMTFSIPNGGQFEITPTNLSIVNSTNDYVTIDVTYNGETVSTQLRVDRIGGFIIPNNWTYYANLYTDGMNLTQGKVVSYQTFSNETIFETHLDLTRPQADGTQQLIYQNFVYQKSTGALAYSNYTLYTNTTFLSEIYHYELNLVPNDQTTNLSNNPTTKTTERIKIPLDGVSMISGLVIAVLLVNMERKRHFTGN